MKIHASGFPDNRLLLGLQALDTCLFLPWSTSKHALPLLGQGHMSTQNLHLPSWAMLLASRSLDIPTQMARVCFRGLCGFFLGHPLRGQPWWYASLTLRGGCLEGDMNRDWRCGCLYVWMHGPLSVGFRDWERRGQLQARDCSLSCVVELWATHDF